MNKQKAQGEQQQPPAQNINVNGQVQQVNTSKKNQKKCGC